MKSSGNKNLPLVLGAVVVVLLGVATAWVLAGKVNKTVSVSSGNTNMKATSTEAGLLDPKVKYDDATGDLKDGGINGEGTFHLERDGGPTHFVYLTSSTLDLSAFIGKKVQVWGLTLASKKAPWLMDVAKIKVQ